jgi:UDP-GlcNAc:undecaprenyl-phosphate GlcNAc-1-phosphate transferase
MTIATYILPLISLIVGFSALPLGTRLKVMDHPGQLHKTHDRPTPLVGGFAIALPLLVYCGLTLWKNPGSQLYAALLVAVGGAFLMGFFDDRRQLPSLFRLLYGAGLALTSIAILPTFIVPHFDFTFLSAPLWLAPFAIAFSVLVIVGMMNAINMLDGMNGLASGLCLIWVVFLQFYAPPEIFGLVMLLAICLTVTLIFNLRGKLFLGDSGTYATGLAIGLLTVYTYNRTGGRLYADAIVAWFIVPVIDCLRLMVVRALRRRSPMTPDTNHLHHRLQRLLPKRWVVPAIWALVAIPGAVVMAFPPLTLAAVLAQVAIYTGVMTMSRRRSKKSGLSYPLDSAAPTRSLAD